MKQASNIELFDVSSASVQIQDEFVHLQRNGFLLCKRGSISLQMDRRLFTVREGDLFIYPAFSQTFVLNFSDDLQGIGGTADFDFVLTLVNSISDTQSHIYIRTHPLVHLTDDERSRIERIIGLVRDRQRLRTPLNARVQSSLVQTFCFEVIDTYLAHEPLTTAPQNRRDYICQSFLIELHRHFRTRREVAFYAGKLNLSPRYFATIIHETSGKSPKEWIGTFVVVEAKRLLSDPKLSVKEVSGLLNFSEPSAFARYFKLYTRLSPFLYHKRTADRR